MTDRSGPACRIFIWAGKGKTGIRRQPYFRQAGDVAVSLAKKEDRDEERTEEVRG